MTVMEIVLLILGALIFAISFIIPESLNSDKRTGGSERPDYPTAREVVSSMKEDINRQVRIAVEESADAAVDDAVVKSERNIEKATNEKMMAIDEYAQTVMRDIDKNHKEVVFLYDMLNNKSIDLKNTIRKAEDTRKQAEEEVKKAAEAAKMEASVKINPVNYEPRPDERPVENIVRERPAEKTVRDRTVTEPVVSTIPPAPKPQIKPVRKSEKNVPRLGRAAAAAFAMEMDEEKVNAESAPVVEEPVKPADTPNAPARPAVPKPDPFVRPDFSGETGSAQTHEQTVTPKVQQEREHRETTMEEDLNDLVISMYRVGTDDVSIARQLGIGVGEVRLMIELYKQGNEQA